MTDLNIVHVNYQFSEIRRYLDHSGVAYRAERDLPCGWGCDAGSDEWTLTFDRAEDALAFRQEYRDLIIPDSHRRVTPILGDTEAAEVSAGAAEAADNDNALSSLFRRVTGLVRAA